MHHASTHLRHVLAALDTLSIVRLVDISDRVDVDASRWPGLQKIGLHHVLLQHALGIKKRTVQSDGLPHDI